MDHPWPILFIIVTGFAMLDVAIFYQTYISRVCERDPSANGPACEFGWTSGWEAYSWIEPGIAPKPFVPIRYDPDGSTTVPARNPRRANAKELRRAYDRAREKLQTLEREVQPKKRKIN